MKAGTLVRIIDDVLAVISSDYIDLNDEFVAPTPAQDAQLAATIENILIKHGVSVLGNVDKVIKALPFIFSIFA